jgi:hypothetical protein
MVEHRLVYDAVMVTNPKILGSDELERIATKYELQQQPGGVSLTRAVMFWRSFSGIEDSYRNGGASVGNVIYNLES